MCTLALDPSDPLVSSRILSREAHEAYRRARARAIGPETAFEVARAVEIGVLQTAVLRVQSAPNPFRS